MSEICAGKLIVLGPTDDLKKFKVADLVKFGDPKIEYESDIQIRYDFFTNNRPDVSVVEEMGKRFNRLVFDYHYYCYELDFSGRYIMKEEL